MSWQRWVLIVIGALLAGLGEATFSTILPSPWRDIRPVLPVAVLFVVLGRPRAGMVWAALGGLMLDLYAIGPSPFSFARLMLTVALISLASLSVLTNRSVYATAMLMTLGRVVEWIVHRAASAVSSLLFQARMPIEPFGDLLLTVVWDVSIVTVAFIVIASFTKRFLVTAPHGYRGYDDL
ncbi:MAG: hypothetical protein V1745_05155 [Patescibacteria group bacterium]